MRAYQHRHHACLLAALLLQQLLFCRLPAGQQLATTFTSTACPGSTTISVTNPCTPLTFTPGQSYRLGPGIFYLSATVSLAAGETLCIIGSSNAGQRTILLPPGVAAGTSASKLHFVLQGARLLLTNLTLSGHTQGPQAGGGGIVIMASSSGNTQRSGSALVTDRVAFR
jgi:hypothetical protein